MTRKQLIEAVIKEAAALKQHATKEEISRLDIRRLVPTFMNDCIYGQMAHDCFCDRAFDLISLCAPVFFDDLLTEGVPQKKSNTRDSVKSEENARNFSAIELYIVQEWAKNKTLIDFIKGSLDSLTVKGLS